MGPTTTARRRHRFPRRMVTLAVAGAVTLVLGVAPADASITRFRNDYNKDQVSDILGIILDRGPIGDCLWRWNGNGAGGFGEGQQVGCGWGNYWPELTAAGDINRDGIGDVVAIAFGGDLLHRGYGNGTGGLAHAGTWGGGWSNYTLAGMGDINKDGHGDLVGIHLGESRLWRWLGNGSGGFKAGVPLRFMSTSWSIT